MLSGQFVCPYCGIKHEMHSFHQIFLIRILRGRLLRLQIKNRKIIALSGSHGLVHSRQTEVVNWDIGML
jgi:hypothetical protein